MNKIIVTGATGYIGAKLCECLLKNGFETGIIKRPLSNIKLLTNFYDKLTSFDYDGSYQSIYNSINLFKPDAVIHLASYQIYEHAQNEIDDILDSNIVLGTYLIEAQRSLKVRYLINV